VLNLIEYETEHIITMANIKTMKKSKTIMKNFKFIYPLFAVLLIFGIIVPSVNAQNLILNPGFENNTLVTGCYTNQSAAFVSANLNNVTAFYGGTQDGIDIGVNNACYAGGANSGAAHIVMAGLSAPNMFESISFALSSPIIAGQDYNLSFYAANSNPVGSESLSVGISTVSTSFGTQAVLVALNTNGSYTLYSATFTAPIGGSFLTVEPATLGDFWFGLDDFSLEASSLGIIENNFGNGLLIYPNPTKENFSIDLGKNYKAVAITITDLNGKFIQSYTYSESQLLNLKLEESAGVYFLIIESEDKKAVIRLVKK
jgi:Secretion system C-terminal sorting domain